MKLIIAVTCLVVAVAEGLFTDDIWEEWKFKHNKKYDANSEDEAIRRFNFETNLKKIDEHNYEFSKGLHTYRMGLNQFSDLTSYEYSKMMLRPFKPNSSGCKKMENSFLGPKGYVTIPTSTDWRKKGIVTKVKNQGQCGSCWAFSTTGSVEAAHALNSGELVSLSEQNLMDCSRPEGDFSCEGGLMDYAFKYIMENGGVDTEDSYPYEAKDENNCRFNKTNVGSTVASCVDVMQDEKALRKAVGVIGPVSVAIDAGHNSFQNYESGVYEEPECSSTQLDHGVLVVGYGSEDGKDYWLVKNSWGPTWGLQGYIKMSRNNNNNCGIATSASYPVV